MKKKLLLFSVLSVALVAAWFYFAPRIRLDMAAAKYNPSEMDLTHLEVMKKSYVRLPNKIEAGIIHLEDGDSVKFWFINRHVQPGLGLTRFEFSDGDTSYLRGLYCCEVSVGEDAIKSKSSMLNYIAKFDGVAP